MSKAVIRRIDEALRCIEADDPLGALPPASAAVESAAHRELPSAKHATRRYQAFFKSYAWVIERVAFGGVLAPRLPGFEAHPGLLRDKEGHCAREDVLQEITRTGVVYAARIAERVVIARDDTLSYAGGCWVIAPRLPLALLVAAVLSPVNDGLRLGRRATVTIGTRTLDVDALWGQAEIARSLLGAR